jgi:hypothetical protein
VSHLHVSLLEDVQVLVVFQWYLVVLITEEKVALSSAGRVFWTLSIIAMGQE